VVADGIARCARRERMAGVAAQPERSASCSADYVAQWTGRQRGMSGVGFTLASSGL
jgi:hypothetical protein